MTRNFGNPGSARGSHAHIDYRAPHAQSPGNDCNPNFNTSAVGKPSHPRSDLAPPDDWRSFIPMPSGSILPADPPLERGEFFQSLIDVCALLAFALLISAVASGVGLLAFAYLGT